MKSNSILMAVATFGLMWGGAVSSQATVPLAVAAYQASVMTEPSRISYYKFDGGNANDSVGSHTGTLAGAAGFGTGFGNGSDKALNLNGSGWCKLGAVPAFDFANGRGTVELEVQANWNPTAMVGKYPVIFANWDPVAHPASPNYVISMYPDKSKILFWQGIEWLPITLPATAGYGWHHLVVEFNAGTWTLIWDGQWVATRQGVTWVGNNGTTQLGSPLPTGGYNSFIPWIGSLDEVAFYSVPLPTDSVKAHNNAFATQFPTLSVSSCGAVVGGGDSRSAISSAIELAKNLGPNSVVQFESGTYRISPDGLGGSCLYIGGANGLSLRGSNTKFIVTDPVTGGLIWDRCVNCSVSGITIDYDPLPFTQGTIVAKNVQANTFDVTIDDYFPLPWEARFSNRQNWGIVMANFAWLQPKAGTDGDVTMSYPPSLVSGRTYRFTPRNPAVVSSQIALYDRFVYLARGGNPVLYFANCTNSWVYDVEVNAGPSAAIVLNGGYGMHIDHFRLSLPAGSNRLLTTDADGIWCVNLRGGPVIANSLFWGNADDYVNIHSEPYPITYFWTVPSQSYFTIKTHAYRQILKVGDRIQVFDPVNGNVRGEANVISVSEYPTADGLADVYMYLDTTISGIQAGTDLNNSDSLFNLSASGEGYWIGNNTFNIHRGSGLRLATGNGTVISNTISGSSGYGIMVQNESGPYYWEGPLGSNIYIYKNGITGCDYAAGGHGTAINIATYGYNYSIGNANCHNNISITW